jgi:hypothetical protein
MNKFLYNIKFRCIVACGSFITNGGLIPPLNIVDLTPECGVFDMTAPCQPYPQSEYLVPISLKA